jgi:acyl-CoA thioesterase I
MKVTFLLALILSLTSCNTVRKYDESTANTADYIGQIKKEFAKEWPNNRTIDLVFHGHSVPAGYFKTPTVNTFDSYPFQVLKQLKDKYPFAVINAINTSIGGETSVGGQKRFEAEVLNHKPDILFIDYALNDRGLGLEDSKKAWEKMIKKAKQAGIKIILLTPSPDLKVNLSEKDNELEKYANQIRALSTKYNIGLADSYARFKQIKADCDCLYDYMSQPNHPNTKGHSVIAHEIMKYFVE